MLEFAILTRPYASHIFLHHSCMCAHMDSLPGPLKPLSFSWEKPQSRKAVPMEVPKLRPRIRLVLQLLESGLKQKEVARMTGYTESRVSQLASLRDPRFVAIRKEARERMDETVVDVGARIRKMANEALNRTADIMRQDKDLGNARLAAKFVLEVAGYSPVKKQATLTATVPTDEFVKAVERMDAADEVRSRASEWEIKQVRSA